MRLVLEGWNLNAAERLICVEALATAGSIVDAAQLLGITKDALKRRIIKHRIEWPGSRASAATASAEAAAEVAVELINLEPKLEPTYSEPDLEVPESDAPTELERVDVARVSRAFSWLAALTPKRIWHEDVGDAIEAICAMERAGCSRSRIRAKFVATYFWVLVAVLRELIAALTGRKSPHK